MTNDGVEFRVLGPLEVHSGGEPLALGGAKQRAVLAVLLLRAGEVVPLERLIDEVWGIDPPRSAAHTLESYVSRLRQLLNGTGPILSRRGAGYAIDLHGAQLDALAFVELQESAALASALDEYASVLELASAGLGMWRGPALADVALASAGRAEAERLEELRLRMYEMRFDAELAVGRHAQSIGELQALVVQNPYRERFVAQLMLALYRSGRHAEALGAYERTRRRLDDDLGLQPSADLQQLSGLIVRQDPSLRPAVGNTSVAASAARAGRRRPAATLVAAAIVGLTLVVTASGGGAAGPDQMAPANAQRLALVLPEPPTRELAALGLERAGDSGESLYDLETQVVYVDPRSPQAGVAGVAARVRNDGVGLVVALGHGRDAQALAKIVPSLPETRFVFVDASLSDLSLEGLPNAAAIRFATEDVLFLAGYLSGIMPTLNASRDRIDRVSVVAAEADRETGRMLAGFKRGLSETNPDVAVRVDYSHEVDDPTACERLANRQVDDGSDVVVALAGRCGLGAVEVARVRGVWSIGDQEDGVVQRPHVLVSTLKNWNAAAWFAIDRLVRKVLPMGRDSVLGVEDDYAAGWDSSFLVPNKVASKLVHRCSQLRASRHRDV